MAINDLLNGKTEQQLIDDNDFINALVGKLTAGQNPQMYPKGTLDTKFDGKVNVDGSNATDPGVTAMLGKLINANKVLKVDGSNATELGVNAMLDTLRGDNRVVKANGDNADNILLDLAASSTENVANVLTRNSIFINAIKTQANAQDPGFQEAVKNVMLHSRFEIPDKADVPISADW